MPKQSGIGGCLVRTTTVNAMASLQPVEGTANNHESPPFLPMLKRLENLFQTTVDKGAGLADTTKERFEKAYSREFLRGEFDRTWNSLCATYRLIYHDKYNPKSVNF